MLAAFLMLGKGTAEAQNGYSLVLTIDANIQRFLEQSLEEAMAEHNVHNYLIVY